jgi:hypothetical protein
MVVLDEIELGQTGAGEDDASWMRDAHPGDHGIAGNGNSM